MNDETHSAFPALVERDIGSKSVRAVDGRELHASLKVGRDFSTWIKDRIAKFGFVEGVDFVTFEDLRSPDSGSAKSRAQMVIEYALALDMAKELAMVENTDEGRQVRRYFIDCERRLSEKPAAVRRIGPRDVKASFKAFLDIGKLIGLEGNQAALAANRATVKMTGIDALAVMDSTHLIAETQEELVTPTIIGQRLEGISAQAVNKKLEFMGLQRSGMDSHGNKTWHPTEKGKPLGLWMDTSKRQGDGTPVLQWKWFAGIINDIRVGSTIAEMRPEEVV